MWPFKKTSSSKQGPTLKKRVVEFWKWFEANAARFHATIDDKRCGDQRQKEDAKQDLRERIARRATRRAGGISREIHCREETLVLARNACLKTSGVT